MSFRTVVALFLAGSLSIAGAGCGGDDDDDSQNTPSESPAPGTDADSDGYVSLSDGGDDCDDANEAINPGAAEVCDSLDNNCDGNVDEGDAAPGTWYADSDSDGHGDATASVEDCTQPTDYVDNSDDCDDTDNNAFPGNTEVCDGVDNDCNDEVDDGISTTASWYLDADGDGYGDENTEIEACAQPDGYVANPLDCDDSADTGPDIHPGATEVCDEMDNDCNGEIDEGDAAPTTWYADSDSDTFGSSATSQEACTVPEGYVADSTDCNDADAAINPNATEVCDEADNNCNGEIDEGDAAPTTWYVDVDTDGFGSSTGTVDACSMPGGYADNDQDCDDTNASINPSAEEVCDGIDNNCDSLTDDGDAAPSIWYQDADTDTFGSSATSQEACTVPDGYVADSTDCDDGDAAINPDATEVCDEVDNNCNDEVDEGDAAPTTWYLDGDSDTYGDSASTQVACTQPGGYVDNDQDCDDGDASINPVAEEVCDQVDNNCNDQVDEGDALPATWYADTDGDLFGNTSDTQESCTAPEGYASEPGDCNDGDASINPDADEVCDQIDNNCDGNIDEGEGAPGSWYADNDLDTYGDPSTETVSCESPDGYVDNGDDCDDGDATVNPAATEVCDEIDNNCDDQVDEGEAAPSTWYLDEDHDGYGTDTDTITSCTPELGYVDQDGDCDDGNNKVNPAATEVCDTVDNNCDGDVDEGDAAPSTWYVDSDGDGYGTDAETTEACTQPPGYADNTDDCDDTNGDVNPDAVEVCNGIDDDCDTEIDVDPFGAPTWYLDTDGDGYGTPDTTQTACDRPDGYVATGNDCNDENGEIYPGAPEHCDEVDESCDGVVDNNPVDGETWYIDADSDGYGKMGTGTNFCSEPDGRADNADDCNDANAAVYPGAPELCDDEDNNCNDIIDETSDDSDIWYVDADADGFGEEGTNNTIQQCDQPEGYVANQEDCDDTNGDVYPDAPENPDDSVDSNCDTFDSNLAVPDMTIGDLVINEIMQNPSVADNSGEWFEIYNATGRYVDLNGLELYDEGSNYYAIEISFVIAPDTFAVLGNNDNTETNGGVAVDFMYQGSLCVLANGSDELYLGNESLVIDKVRWDNGATFPDPSGASMSLDPDFMNSTDNDEGANWCEATSKYSASSYGTPGEANDQCE